MSISPTPVVTLGRWVWVTVAFFLVNGLLVGSWGASIPSLRQTLGFDERGVAASLIVMGAGSILSMQLAGRVADRRGPLLPCLVSAVSMAAGAAGLAVAASYRWLLPAAFLFGVGNGAMDVTMNLLGVRVEQAWRRSVMNRFHAAFSAGAFGGAGLVLLGGRLLGQQWPGAGLLLAVTLAMLLISGVIVLTYNQRQPSGEHQASLTGRMPRVAWLLAVIGLCVGLTEGTATDWSAVHVADVTGVSPSQAAIGTAAVAVTMLLVRLLGDRMVDRIGRAATLRWCAAVMLLGWVLVVTVSSLPLVVVGWLLVGLGVGLVFPQVYAAAGYLGGGRTMALMTTFGYSSMFIGPAVIGFTAAHTDIQHAMLVPMALTVVVAASTLTPALTRSSNPASNGHSVGV